MVRKLDYVEPHPAWRMMFLTEFFGPIGTRWGLDQIDRRISKDEASTCYQAWWTDGDASARVIGKPCWGTVPMGSPECMSQAADKAINLALAEAEKVLPIRMIPLSDGAATIVDAEDYSKVGGFVWSVFRTKYTSYAVRGANVSGKPKMFLMHREIMGPEAHEKVDHRDRNGLNNRRSNLRTCTNQENMRNTGARSGTSQFKGVSRVRTPGKWSAQIMVDGKKRHLGVFSDEFDAAKAYDRAAKELFGDFAYTNFGG